MTGAAGDEAAVQLAVGAGVTGPGSASDGPLLVRGATAVWTGDRVIEDADVLSASGRVIAVGPGLADEPDAADATVIDATGCVVIPGLVNAHHHLLQSAFRTLPGTRHVAMRDWLPAMAAAYAAAGIDGELCHATASVGLAEALLCGVTTVADHHLNWPSDPAEHLPVAEAVAAAAGALGARVVLVRGSAGDDPEIAGQAADDVASRFGAVSVDGMIGVAVGPAGVHSDGEATFAALRAVALEHGLARRTQANEQVDTEIAVARYGRRPLELLEEWGWLEPGVTIAHLCDVTPAEIDILAETGVTATHAPGCDLPMGWGLAPAGALLDAGIVVGLGTSGGGSNDAGHLLADARLAMQVAPLRGRPLTAIDALTMATRGSAIGLGRPELGHLEPGAAADLAIYDFGGVADAGVADPVGGLLWAAPGRRPRDVVVAGRLVVEGGTLLRRSESAVTGELAGVLAARKVAA